MKEFHPIAEIFPLLNKPGLDALAADIVIHGLREAIVLHPDGRILDGRNRAHACELAGVEPRYRTWDEVGSLIDFVLSVNLHRRHLTVSQLGIVGARLANLEPCQHASARALAVTEPEAARLLGVGLDTIKRGRRVLASGDAALIASVVSGAMRIKKAARLARDAEVYAARAPTPATPTKRSKAARAARAERMRDLAGRGYTSRQIADAVMMDLASCRVRLKADGIVVPADRIVGKVQHFRAPRIVEQMVFDAEHLTADVDLIDLDALDPADLKPWIARLSHARRSLDAFIRLLTTKERHSHAHSSKEQTGARDHGGNGSAPTAAHALETVPRTD